MESVPFAAEAVGGMAECHGVARFEGGEVVIEFQLKDSFFGLLKSRIRVLSVALGDLESAEFKKGMVSGSIHLRAKSMLAFEGLPGSEPATAVLSVARKHRDDAEAFAHRLANAIVNLQYKRTIEPGQSGADPGGGEG